MRDSPVLITSSPPTAGQCSVIEPSIPSSRSPHWALSSSPSQRLPSPSSFLPWSSTAKARVRTRSPPFRLSHGFKTAAHVLEGQVAHGVFESGRHAGRSPIIEKTGEDRANLMTSGNDTTGWEPKIPASVCEEPTNVPERELYNASEADNQQNTDACGSHHMLRPGLIDTAPHIPVAEHTNPPNSTVLAPVPLPLPMPFDQSNDPANTKKKPKAASAKRPTPKSARKRLAKSASIILNSDDPEEPGTKEVSEVITTPAQPGGWSALIHETAVPVDIATRQAQAVSADVPVTEVSGQADAQPVLRRRMSWTPAKNTAPLAVVCGQPTVDRKESASPTPDSRQSLAALVSRFSHLDQASSSNVPRISNGEAVTKRRRISTKTPADVGAVNPPPVKARKSEKKKRVKVVKGPKTITALATSAFQPQPEPISEPAETSEFFATTDNPVNAKDTGEKPPKAKRSSKSRARAGEKSTKAKKAASAKGLKVKRLALAANESNLLPPAEARACEAGQEFLFGTSSQLAVEDSPTFIKEMQSAIRNSEAVAVMQADTSPHGKSYARVATAPHGTLLSVGQAEKSLWRTAARDHSGAVLGLQEKPRISGETGSATSPPLQQGANRAQTSDTKEKVDAAEGSKQVVVDLYQSSPLPRRDSHPVQERHTESATNPNPGEQAIGSPHSKGSPFSDSWMLLQSGESTPESPRQRLQVVIPSPLPSPHMSGAIRHADSPTKLRVALQSLDANIKVVSNASPIGSKVTPQRSITTTAAHALPRNSSTTKARGRPSKTRTVTSKTPAVDNPPRKRGRPPKSSPAEHAPSRAVASISPEVRDTPSSFKDIDEISDSDPPSPTPSPPRRRKATTSVFSPSPQPLDLQADDPFTTIAPSRPSTVPKPGDGHWPTIRPVIFTQITAAITSAPRSDDLRNPSWHEKILLYDPIVLEDLTAWLNAQGIRFEVRRLVTAKEKSKSKSKSNPKSKSKASGSRRRKKGASVPDPIDGDGDGTNVGDEGTGGREADGEDGEVEGNEQQSEYQTCREPLLPWMVQKWCEEKSVCCLWKEGLRGGVRTRY